MFATLCSQSRRALLQGRLRWVTSIPDGDSFSSLRGDLVCCSIRRSGPRARMSKDAVRGGYIVLAAKLNDVCHCRKGSALQSKRSGGME